MASMTSTTIKAAIETLQALAIELGEDAKLEVFDEEADIERKFEFGRNDDGSAIVYVAERY